LRVGFEGEHFVGANPPPLIVDVDVRWKSFSFSAIPVAVAQTRITACRDAAHAGPARRVVAAGSKAGAAAVIVIVVTIASSSSSAAASASAIVVIIAAAASAAAIVVVIAAASAAAIVVVIAAAAIVVPAAVAIIIVADVAVVSRVVVADVVVIVIVVVVIIIIVRLGRKSGALERRAEGERPALAVSGPTQGWHGDIDVHQPQQADANASHEPSTNRSIGHFTPRCRARYTIEKQSLIA
jgi:hypothetical protein